MKPNEVTAHIVNSAYHVHTDLRHGFPENVDQVTLAFELQRRGLTVERQVPIAVEYEGIRLTSEYEPIWRGRKPSL